MIYLILIAFAWFGLLTIFVLPLMAMDKAGKALSKSGKAIRNAPLGVRKVIGFIQLVIILFLIYVMAML